MIGIYQQINDSSLDIRDKHIDYIDKSYFLETVTCLS